MIKDKLKKQEIGTVIKQDILESLVNTAYLGIGSNLGSRKNYIERAKYLIKNLNIHIVKSSSIYETPSWPNSIHPKYFNVVIKIKTKLNPQNLFVKIKEIEKKLGRTKSKKNSPRTCDIDIIDFNNQIMNFKYNNMNFTVPHKKLSYRNFVLFPLHEIIPKWKHPKTKEKIDTLIDKLSEDDRKSILKVNKS